MNGKIKIGYMSPKLFYLTPVYKPGQGNQPVSFNWRIDGIAENGNTSQIGKEKT
jgi:hypothetical protein